MRYENQKQLYEQTCLRTRTGRCENASSTNGKFDTLEPVAFKNFSNFGNHEKDLEDLIAGNILEVLFEDASLMPISIVGVN